MKRGGLETPSISVSLFHHPGYLRIPWLKLSVRLLRMHKCLEKGIQILYRACEAREGFPGAEPSKKDGSVSTLSILARLGVMEPSDKGLEEQDTFLQSHANQDLACSPGSEKFVLDLSTSSSNSSKSSSSAGDGSLSSSAMSPIASRTRIPLQPRLRAVGTPQSLSSVDPLTPLDATERNLGGITPQTLPTESPTPALRQSSPAGCETENTPQVSLSPRHGAFASATSLPSLDALTNLTSSGYLSNDSQMQLLTHECVPLSQLGFSNTIVETTGSYPSNFSQSYLLPTSPDFSYDNLRPPVSSLSRTDMSLSQWQLFFNWNS